MSSSEVKTEKIAMQAIERIKAEGLTPLPEIFDLFYNYYSGENPEVVRSIDIMKTQNFDLTAERCRELRERLIERSDEVTKETLEKVEKVVGTTLQDFSQLFENLKHTNEDFSGSVEEISRSLIDAIQAEQLRNLLKTVLQEAHKMVSENSQLEKKLEKSSELMQELKNEMEMVRHEAYTDTLTGIPNRKKFDLEIVRLSSEALYEKTPISLIFIDIDHFKSFNDTFGHQIGDQVLRLVAKSLKESLKGQDFSCRYGGEEFVIILPKTALDGGIKIAEILREQIRGKDIKNRLTGETLSRISISCGVAQLKEKEDLEDWIERADRALYKAKQQGRNRVVTAA